MDDHAKSKQQLIRELEQLRGRVAALEATITPPEVQKQAAAEEAEVFADAYDQIAQEHNERIAQAIKGAHTSVCYIDVLTGTFVASTQALSWHGFTPDTPLTHTAALSAVHPEDRPKVKAAWQSCIEEGAAYLVEYRITQNDGTIRWIAAQVQHVPELQGGKVLVMFQDITEQKRTEKVLRESLERLHLAKNAAQLGIHDHDLVSGSYQWDERMRELWGVGPGEPITDELFMAGLHPEDRAARQAAINKALDPAGTGEYYAEYRVINRHDGTARWIASTGQVFFEHQQPRRVVGIVQDITSRKRAEEGLRESEARAKALNDQVLSMLMVVAHDLRSPLIALQATLKLLLRGIYGTMDKSVKNTVIDLNHRADTLLRVAEECLAGASVVAGDVEAEKKVLDLREDIIDPILKELSSEIEGQAITIDNRLGGIPAARILVTANKVWLKIVYRNLFRNAIKYGDKGGLISFGCEDHGSYYKLNVYNSGKPIPEEARERLFTQFYRVGGKVAFEGMGLGLYLTRKIIRKHGGDIWYEAKEYGSNFVFTFPHDER